VSSVLHHCHFSEDTLVNIMHTVLSAFLDERVADEQ